MLSFVLHRNPKEIYKILIKKRQVVRSLDREF